MNNKVIGNCKITLSLEGRGKGEGEKTRCPLTLILSHKGRGETLIASNGKSFHEQQGNRQGI